MVGALVITLREGMEAALVLGIILTYLNRTGRTLLNRYVYIGLALAIAVSIAGGIVIQAIGFDPENEVMEGILLGIGGVFVASMVVWMWRTARSVQRQMEARMQALVGGKKVGWGVGLGILAFTFFMVAREGMETVVFLSAITMGQASIMDGIGAFLGIGLAVLFAILFIRGSLRINLGRFFTVTSLVLLVLAARLLLGSAHEFAEVGLLPMASGVMKVLGYFVRDRASDVLLMVLIAVPIVLLLWDIRRAPIPTSLSGETRAQSRQRLATQRWERTWQWSLMIATVAIILAMTSKVIAASPFIDPPPVPVSASDGEIRLSVADWEPYALKKFAYAVDGIPVRFLAVKLEDGSVATGLDACQICGTVGYMEERDGRNAICKNCNAPIPMETLGLGGGCNPLPLDSYLEGTRLAISVKGLSSQAQLFRPKMD